MELEHKPDFEEARKYWDAFWQGEIIDRPCVHVTAVKDGCEPPPGKPYPNLVGADYEADANRFEEAAAVTYYGAEAIPHWYCSFGPDQFAAFLGGKLNQRQEDRTSWVEPYVKNWDDVAPLTFDNNNSVWQEMLEMLRVGTRVGEGKWLIGVLDYHTHLDAMQAIRGGVEICMDLMDCPDTIERIVLDMGRIFEQMYDEAFEACKMGARGSIGWAPFYSRGRFSTVQCDFIYLIGPEMGRRFAIPGIEREAAMLDNCVFHLDGKNSLPHLDDILAIPDIDVIQWVPGAGQPGHIGWMDLLKRIQKGGKGLQVHASIEQIKVMHKELKPEKTLYVTGAKSVKEADDLIAWLKRNT